LLKPRVLTALALGIGLIGLAVFSAIRNAPDLPTVTGTRVFYSLLTGAQPEILESNPETPIATALVMPLDGMAGDGGALPALLLSPPAEVRYTIPDDVPPGSYLRLALGMDQPAYELAGVFVVRFKVILDDELVHSSLRKGGAKTRRKQRTWERLEFPVSPGMELRLRTDLVRGNPEAIHSAVGLLEIMREVELPRTRSDSTHPNLVLVVIDTLRADRLGAQGGAESLSRNLDQLAEQGTSFEQAYAPASWTWPSTASILTGLSPAAHGVQDLNSCYLAHELETLAERLQSAGFATAASSTNPLIAKEKNFDQGFDEFHTTEWKDSWDAFVKVDPWLRSRGEERFFLYLQLTEPHSPYDPDPEKIGIWKPTDKPAGFQGRTFKDLRAQKNTGKPYDAKLLAEIADYFSHRYDGEVEVVDRAIEDLVARLREIGALDNTIIAITSDHGDEFLDHGLMGHGKQLYEESVHVPLIILGPGVNVGRHEQPVDIRHLGGTLLDLMGLSRGSYPDGPNLLDPEDLAGLESDPLICSTRHGRWFDRDGTLRPDTGPVYSLRRGDLLLLWRPTWEERGETEDWRLFDLEADPAQVDDLSLERSELCERMIGTIQRWLEVQSRDRPSAVHGGVGTLELLEGIGYVEK